MFSLHDETAVKIHTAPDRTIWYSTGINPPESSGQILDTFLLSPVIGRLSTNIRVIGVPQNSELIASLYLRKARRELASICLAGPNICGSMLELDDPVTALMRMRDVYFAASRGGWHEMTELEYSIYALLARQRRLPTWFDKTAQSFYEAHPLFKVINFVKDISHKHAIELITTIIDPRWYVDQRRPDNPTKLALYLGLTPKTQNRVSDTTKLIKRGREFRCATVLNCWKNQDPETVDYSAPENFLWRIWKQAGGGSKGDLRASQAFVRYLRANWLDIISQRRAGCDNFFAPRHFFKSDEEQQAFVRAVV
jgi:hypothetical protein